MSNDLYESDEYLWKQEIAKKYQEAEPNLFEYLMEMARNEEREIKSKCRVLFLHLLKYQYQSEKQSISWVLSIRSAYRDLTVIFNDSKSLYNRYIDETYFISAYKNAVLDASTEIFLSKSMFPKVFPWDPKTVWTEEFVETFLMEYIDS